MNSVILIGRLTRDIELKFMPQSGTAVAKFSIAVDKDMSREKKNQAAQEGKPTADFLNVTVFGKQAESCSNFLTKGSKCCVNGRITSNNYTTQTGEKRNSVDIIADKVEFLDNKQNRNNTEEDEDDVDIFKPTDDDFPF